MRVFAAINLLVVSLSVSSQDYFDRDSLWQELKKSKPDTNKVWIYIQLGQQYETNNPDTALMLYEEALKLSRQLKYTRGEISYYTNATYVYNEMGLYDTALNLNLQSVEIARRFGSEERIAACLGNVGVSYNYLNLHEKAIEYYLAAGKILERLNDKVKLCLLYGNLGIVYKETHQLNKAEEYSNKAVTLARELKNIYSITNALINRGTVYTSLQKYTLAISDFEEASKLARKSDNLYALSTALINLGDVNIKMSQFDRLKKYFSDALRISEETNNHESIAISLRGLSIYYFNHNNADSAEYFAHESMRVAQQFNLVEHIGEAYKELSSAAILKRDFRRSNEYLFKSDSISNVLFNQSIARNMQELEMKYESEKKEQRIKDLQQESEIKDLDLRQRRLINVVLGIVLIAVAGILVLARRTHRQKQKLMSKESEVHQARIAKLESEKLLLASEAIIKGQEDERGRLAKDLHDGLGGLLSGIKFSLTNMKSHVILDAESALVFERSLDMLDHSISELRRVAHNMMPEVLVKFGLEEALKSYCESIRQSGLFLIDFQSIGMETRLSSSTEIILYRIIQELLNNIAKHAKATQVLVQLARHDHEVTVTVEDNGVGFDSNTLENVKGAGWANIRSRVEYLKGKVDVKSAPGQGTSIYISLTV
ncbi:MAG: sensor histidine kinase [Cyclobacteriaceae bacterium]|nr:sensor histidine kinase [Cyclobacteriaceae bacterium]